MREGAPLREAVLSTFLRADKLRGTAPAATTAGSPKRPRCCAWAARVRSSSPGWRRGNRRVGAAQRRLRDWLPGRLLVEEAGGRTAVIEGEPLTWFVAAAPGTFEELVALVSAGG